MLWRMPSVNYNIASELSHELDPRRTVVRALRARAGTVWPKNYDKRIEIHRY